MIYFKIYNDDRIRHWNKFPKLNDPNVLELSLLRIINEYLETINSPYQFKEFNIHDPFLNSMLFTYYSSSNFNAWGQLPLGYIYNDMVRHIQNRNTSNNFVMTLESIFIDKKSLYNEYEDSIILSLTDISYEIITSYITENYLNSYKYILNNNNGVLAVIIPKEQGLLAYIISVGFDPFAMSKWFCTSHNLNNPDSVPYTRYCSLLGLARTKLSRNIKGPALEGPDSRVMFECAESKLQRNIDNCKELVSSYDISNLRKKSIYDTEVKYGDYPIDYNWLNLYDAVVPAAYLVYTFRSGGKVLLNKFNQPEEYRADYRLLKRQDDIVKIEKKIKQMKE